MAVSCRCRGRISLRERLRKGIPLGVLSLRNETVRREPRRHRLWFCIAGKRGTGRNTLATRFNAMDGDEFMPGDVVFRNVYRFTIDLSNRPELNESGLVHVGILIEPPFREGEINEHLFDNVRAFIFLYDVSDFTTLDEANVLFDNWEMASGENMQPFIFVGNKSDRRESPHEFPVCIPYWYAETLAVELGALGCYECSALRNTGVGPILDMILRLIIR
ncbi:uncharacterized protein LOC129966252 [Argiope bruennichi]|uniref:Uncharacterized protein n=1 Tax=Argiope bruennichi TaxID=94029 RepID=A0A8T0E6T8_ARGBR|nr:uncharacterized protein LOC129966252 [Argiope bruennichi]KAF8766986.1 hypothetical protein HNY73_020000 [Argiope bruennichi]